MLPNLGDIDETDQVLSEVVTACTERGDLFHLGSAISSRRNLWVARRDLANALKDQERFIPGAQAGHVGWEYFAEHNSASCTTRPETPEPPRPISRAIALERRHPRSPRALSPAAPGAHARVDGAAD